MSNLVVIEHQERRVLLTSQIAEAYETTGDVISKNFNRNKERYVEGKHYYCLEGQEKRNFVNHGQFDDGLRNATKLYLWTEKGAFLHAKSLNTDKAWEVYDRLVDSYFNHTKTDTSQLSPQLQAFNQLFQAMAHVELGQKKLEGELQDIRDAIVLDPAAWRVETTNLINKIAMNRGGYENIKTVRKESYELLDSRAKSKLGIRQTNMKRKVLEETGSKSKAEKITKLDVIAADSRLREVYIAIIKEMSVKYGVA